MMRGDGAAVTVSGTGWRLARIEAIPALPPSDDPEYWREWTDDPAYNEGWHSVGRHLGVGSFGINAKEAARNGELVVRHSETEFGGQEELYFVLTGRARFVCDGEEVELRQGDVLHVEAAVVREAVALETPTLLVAVGGVPGEAYVTPDWNIG